MQQFNSEFLKTGINVKGFVNKLNMKLYKIGNYSSKKFTLL